MVVTESMVERFGLFIIIVLGEVVVGVVEGMSEAVHHEGGYDAATFATGLLALTVGFGLWWVFFGFVGRRLPRNGGSARSRWMIGHLPIALGIAAAGAAMVSLIGHAHSGHTPSETAWLLTGSVSTVLVGVMITTHALRDWERQSMVYRPLIPVLGAGVVAALLVGWWQPAPWLLAFSLSAILSAIWFFAVYRWLMGGFSEDTTLPT